MKRVLWIAAWIMFGTLLGTDSASPVFACSGAMAPIDYLIERADVVVKAEVVEVDDLGVNGIVHVDSYLVGDAGPEFLAVSEYNSQQVRWVMDGRGVCGLDPVWWHQGEERILFLERYDDGSHRLLTGAWDDDYLFEDEMSTVNTRYINDGAENEYITVTEAELRELIAEKSGQTPSEPLPDAPYPLHAPILIQTETGSAYMLPMDGHDPVLISNSADHVVVADIYIAVFQGNEIYVYRRGQIGTPSPLQISEDVDCSAFDCLSFTPDGTIRAFQLTHDTIQFDSVYYDFSPLGHELSPLDGQGLQFSRTSDSFVLWDDNEILVHRLVGQVETNEQNFEEELTIGIVEINSATLEFDDGITAAWSRHHTVWSDDGQRLAFSDANGLWIWDVLTDGAEPQLILETDSNGMPTPRYLSPHGRYVAVEHADHLFTLEIGSGRELPYGIVSPDGRYFAAFVQREGTLFLEGCYLTPFECHWVESSVEPSGTWINLYTFFGTHCREDHCIPTLTRFPTSGYRGDFVPDGSDFQWFIGIQHQVETVGDNLLVLNKLYGGSIISVGMNWTARDQYDPMDWVTFDLEDKLDGDIVSVEWLPSMFIQGSY